MFKYIFIYIIILSLVVGCDKTDKIKSCFPDYVNKIEFRSNKLDIHNIVDLILPKAPLKLNKLKPITHKRLMTCYYIARTLKYGTIPLKSQSGRILVKVTKASRRRLNMEGTAYLPNGRLINVAGRVNGEMRYIILNSKTHPYGKGIYSTPLVPWKSAAINIKTIRKNGYFKRNISILDLKGYKTPSGKVLDGVFTIHDTGGGMNQCPFKKGMCRTPTDPKSSDDYGQVDIFVKDWDTYKKVRKFCFSYVDTYIHPSNINTIKGRKESLNLLLDLGLNATHKITQDYKEGIKLLQTKVGLPLTGYWDKDTNEYVKKIFDS